MSEKLLEIKNLSVQYRVENEVTQALRHVSLELDRGKTIGLVGETGAGKTTLALSIMRMIPDPPGRIVEGEIMFDGENLLKKSASDMRKIRGYKVSMIYQDPMTSLNPIMTIGTQIEEVLLLHNHISKAEAIKRTEDILNAVGIPTERYKSTSVFRRDEAARHYCDRACVSATVADSGRADDRT